jgi:hypothetical protein
MFASSAVSCAPAVDLDPRRRHGLPATGDMADRGIITAIMILSLDTASSAHATSSSAGESGQMLSRRGSRHHQVLACARCPEHQDGP